MTREEERQIMKQRRMIKHGLQIMLIVTRVVAIIAGIIVGYRGLSFITYEIVNDMYNMSYESVMALIGAIIGILLICDIIRVAKRFIKE